MGEAGLDTLLKKVEGIDAGGETDDGDAAGGDGCRGEGWANGLDDVDWRSGQGDVSLGLRVIWEAETGYEIETERETDSRRQ